MLKKIIVFKHLKSTFLLAIIILLSNCSSDDDNSDGFIGTFIDLEFTIRNDEIVIHELGDFGESGTASIRVNPENFSVNRLIGSEYTYEPSNNFVGEDFVEISHSIVNTNLATNNVESRFFRTRITIIVIE